MDPLLDRGYHLFTDNYYTCPELYAALCARQTACTGTVRCNRVGMPKDMVQQQLEAGEHTYRRKGDLATVKWRDKRDIYLLTSAHDPTATTSVTTRHVENKIKPTTVAQYSKHMSGVDHSDQLLSYLPLARRTGKWTNKIFYHFLTLCVIQSAVILNKIRAGRALKPIKLPAFFKYLGKELTQDYIQRRNINANRSEARSVTKPELSLRLDHSQFHSLTLNPPTETKKKPYRACKVCYDKTQTTPGKRKRTKETHYMCDVCRIPLCLEPCFKIFHTRADYKQD